MPVKIYLRVVEPEEGDSILAQKGKTDDVLFKGDEQEENLACGRCSAVIARHVSIRTLYQQFMAPKRALARCLCGAHNLIPARL